jgi:glucosyl-dolichyl phosphate glucuronosyltransferase
MISVVIPTYNRVELLKKAVESILRQNYSDLVLVVVDNNSSDGTQAYVEAVCRIDSRVRYIREPRQGLSYAKNTGVGNAVGDIVAILDDDEKASPGWVGEITASFNDYPSVGCVGGRTILEDKHKIPGWISPKLYNCIGEWDIPRISDKPAVVGRVDFMGGNMAFSKSAFYKAGGFNEGLGRKGNVLLAGEDTELCHKIYDTGFALLFNPRAIVFHALIPTRPTMRYLWKNARGLAYTRVKKGKMLSFSGELIYRVLKFPVDLIRFRHLSYTLYRLLVAFYKLEGLLQLQSGKCRNSD